MTISSQEQQPTTVNTSQNQVRTSKRRLWLRLISTFIIIFLIITLILVILTATRILPPQWFTALPIVLIPVIVAFLKGILFDEDFLKVLGKWLTRKLFGDAGDKRSDNKNSKDSIPQKPAQSTISDPQTATPLATGAMSQGGLTNRTDSVTQPPTISLTTQSPALPPPSSNAIFFVSTKLTDSKEFYGRAIEREQLLSHTRNGGCTSIIGPRRIGKTWLLTYLRLVAAQELGANFRIGYMSAALPSSATIAGFSAEALKALGCPSSSLPKRSDLKLLEHFVRDIVLQNHTPILCMDEFEGLTHHAEFDLDFFEGLRAITEIGLGLIVLSKKPLIEIVSENTRTSPFFNVFLQLPLAPFDREDAERFWQEKGAQAQFTDQERAYALLYSRTDGEQFPPLRLQLVGNMLLNEKYVIDPVAQQRYRPNDLEYWSAFKQRVDMAYGGMVKS